MKVDWTCLAQDKVQLLDLGDMEMSLQVPKKIRKFKIICGIITF
jgi:hypothetical protein